MADRSRRRADWLWGAAAAAALLWPSHALGVVDGVPLDGRVEAILIGVVLPAVWWLHPRFTSHRAARVAIVGLIALKAVDAVAIPQQGWCGRFVSEKPLAFDGSAVQHAWDARADWRDSPPRCSAVVSRQYLALERFPIWFLNMAPASGRPPHAVVRFSVEGYVAPTTGGTLSIGLHDAQWIRGSIGSLTIDRQSPDGVSAALPPGLSPVALEMSFTGDRWAFDPLWNGRSVFEAVRTTTAKPGAGVKYAGVVSFLGSAFALAFVGAWLVSAIVVLRPTPAMAAWIVGASALCATVAAIDLPRDGRIAILILAAAPFVSVPRRLQSLRGAFLIVGVPWLTLFVAGRTSGIGSVTFYTPGDDFTEFQRYAYRIFMQGYWLEGGQKTFWFQPLYRWIAGCIHVVFGDSSVGELYGDAAALLVGALFAFYLARREAGFRWGVAAAVGALLTAVVGPSWYLVGRGLSEIVSSGFIYLAAFCVLRARVSGWMPAIGAGVLAVLGFYTRLNNLPFALATIVFAMPLGMRASEAWRPVAAWARARKKPVAAVLLSLAAALHILALRTWHYTGMFSAFFGTQRDYLSTIRPADSLVSTARLMIDSVLVLVTMQDPPRLDLRATLVMVGAIVSLLALLRVPGARDLPLAPTAWCLAALAGALVARGTSYVGRFSIHLIPISVAVAMCAAARVAHVRSHVQAESAHRIPAVPS